MIEKAADAVAGYADFKTIKMALGSSSETLQFWALWNLRALREGTADRWATLLPRVRELATCDSDHIRGQALEKLECFEGQEAFLSRCLKSETCLGNLLRPLYGGNGEGFHDRFNPHVLRLLGHKDEKVRCEALAFIGFNSHRAPMWQITFTEKVVRRVFELSRSRSIKERANAVYALADLRSYDPKAIRERMIELVKDESEDVRWRIPGALANQLDRADVQAALAQLMRDKSATVRYFTILELGPEKHLTELRALASGPDKKIAQWAAERILQLPAQEP